MLTGRRGSNPEAIVEDVVREAQQRHVRVRIIAPRAGSLDEAQGPQSLAAAYGLARWPGPPQAGNPPDAPRDSPDAPPVLPDTFALALRRGPAIALGRRLDPGPGLHTFHAVVIDGISGDSTRLLHCQVHGQDPLGTTFSFTVAGFQNHFRIHHLLYRA
jgi:hypothetical protein